MMCFRHSSESAMATEHGDITQSRFGSGRVNQLRLQSQKRHHSGVEEGKSRDGCVGGRSMTPDISQEVGYWDGYGAHQSNGHDTGHQV